MESMDYRMRTLEELTANMRRQLIGWRLITLCLAISLVFVARLQRVQAEPAQPTVVRAPFSVMDSTGQKTLISITEGENTGGAKIGVLTFYSNGVPVVGLKNDIKTYQDAEDSEKQYLDLLETDLIRVGKDEKGKPTTVAFRASTLGLTRRGASLVLYNAPSDAKAPQTFAARLGPRAEEGGELELFAKDGSLKKTVSAGK